MESLSFVWIWLVFTGCIICSPPKQFSSGVKSFDIPRVIDSIHQLYQNRETYRQICWKRRESLITELNLKGYDDIWIDLSRFLRRIRDLRTLLLMEDVVEKDIENNIKDPFMFAMISVFTMKDVIDDLRPRFIEWKRQGIRDIKEDITFEWFNYHRFTKDILKDVEMKDFAGMVEGIYKENVFSRRLLEFGGTTLFLKAECHPYNITPWIVSFYNNPNVIKIFENDIRSTDDAPDYLINQVQISFQKCRSKGHMCLKLFDAYNKKEAYSLYMNIYSHACVDAEQAELCLSGIGWMAQEFTNNPSYMKLKYNVEKRGSPFKIYTIPGFTSIRKSGSHNGASRPKPPNDGPSSAMGPSFLYDEEELGFSNPDRKPIAQPELNEKSERRKHRRNAVRGRRSKT